MKRVWLWVVGAPVAVFVGSAMVAGVVDGGKPDPAGVIKGTKATEGTKGTAAVGKVVTRAPAGKPAAPPAASTPAAPPAVGSPSEADYARVRKVLKAARLRVRELTLAPGSGAFRPCKGLIAMVDVYSSPNQESATEKALLATDALLQDGTGVGRVLVDVYQRMEDTGEMDRSLYSTQTDLGGRTEVLEDYQPGA